MIIIMCKLGLSLHSDRKAVSPLIGFVLMLAIIMGLIGIMQSKWVPAWNKEVEAKHLDRISYEMAELSEAITLAASSGSPAKVVLEAGVSYPQYYVLISPSKAAGTVERRLLNVNVSGVGNFTSSAIIFRPNYLYSSSPKFVFEHSAVLKVQDSHIIADSDQNSFSRDRVTLYIFNASFHPFSTTDNLNFLLYPVSYGGTTRYSGTVEFECYDENTAQWWNATLSAIYGADNVSVRGNSISLRLDNVELSINYMRVAATPAGALILKEELEPVFLRPLLNNETTYRVSTGEVRDFGVLVLDKFLNPVRDQDKLSMVSVSAECGACEVYTNPSGEVWCTFTAGESECQGVLRFSLGSEFVEYDVDVMKLGLGGGIFDVAWNVSGPYEWNVSSVGYEKNFKVTVSYNSNPVANINVDIAADNASVISFPSSVVTDSRGESIVDVWALSNGTANLFAAIGGSIATLELHITGVGACHGWGYWREITVTNDGSALTDYQIKIELDSSNFDFDHAKSDGSDIRFYDSDRVTALSYWIEEWNSGSEHAIIWVKIPSIPSGTKRIYMYYGNPSAVDEGNISRVFIPGNIAMFAYDWRNDLYGPYADSNYEFNGAINSKPSELHSEYVNRLCWAHSGDSDSGAFGSFPFRAYDFMTVFKFLLVPGDRPIQRVATDSDDASEVLVDGNVRVAWYGGHAPCYRGCEGTPDSCWNSHSSNVNINEPTWIEYRMQEWYGIEAAKMAIKFTGDNNWYILNGDALPYNTKIYARKYADPEPTVSIGPEQTC